MIQGEQQQRQHNEIGDKDKDKDVFFRRLLPLLYLSDAYFCYPTVFILLFVVSEIETGT